MWCNHYDNVNSVDITTSLKGVDMILGVLEASHCIVNIRYDQAFKSNGDYSVG